MEPAQLTSAEESVLEAIAVLARLLGELGLVQEVDGGRLGPYFALSGRAGAQPAEGSTQEVNFESAGLAGDLERYLASLEFPATTEAVIEASAGGATPQPLVQALRRLPPDRGYVTLQELAEELRSQL